MKVEWIKFDGKNFPPKTEGTLGKIIRYWIANGEYVEIAIVAGTKDNLKWYDYHGLIKYSGITHYAKFEYPDLPDD